MGWRNRCLTGGILCGLIIAANSADVRAASYNEAVSGDLSNSQAAPTPLALTVGANSIIGTVNGGTGDSQDWIELTVPAGAQMASYVNAAYSSSDLQGFTGFQAGPSFVGSPFSATSYAGFAHFGSNATGNGAGAAANTVGQNLLPAPYMADPSVVAQGATGFTPPLGPGNYTFLIQQLGGATSYEFDMNVTAVPEPGSLCLMTVGGLLLVAPVARKLRRQG